MKTTIRGLELELGNDSKKDYNAATKAAIAFFLNPFTGIFACTNAYKALKLASKDEYKEAGRYYKTAVFWAYLTYITFPVFLSVVIYFIIKLIRFTWNIFQL